MKVSYQNIVFPLNRYHPPGGFTLLEVILVVVLIALVVSLTAVFSVEAYQTSRDKKRVMEMVQAVSDLRSTSIHQMKDSRVYARDNRLILDLSGREVRRFSFEEPETCSMTDDIRFNRYGLTTGGEILVGLSRQYRILVDGIQGRISLEEI